tara:strand:+ start:1004 stop:1285 length:282 start_codon:yes stop_codon:yes gene_type:complete
VDGTETENYTYDQIGNLISDNAEGIDSIAWTPYGKVRAVYKDDNSEVHFRYDASEDRPLRNSLGDCFREGPGCRGGHREDNGNGYDHLCPGRL